MASSEQKANTRVGLCSKVFPESSQGSAPALEEPDQSGVLARPRKTKTSFPSLCFSSSEGKKAGSEAVPCNFIAALLLS